MGERGKLTPLESKSLDSKSAIMSLYLLRWMFILDVSHPPPPMTVLSHDSSHAPNSFALALSVLTARFIGLKSTLPAPLPSLFLIPSTHFSRLLTYASSLLP